MSVTKVLIIKYNSKKAPSDYWEGAWGRFFATLRMTNYNSFIISMASVLEPTTMSW